MPQETNKVRNPKHLQGKRARSWRGVRYQGQEPQEEFTKIVRVHISVCVGKLQERVRYSAPHKETRTR